jgi:GGDEF domain-containing protein
MTADLPSRRVVIAAGTAEGAALAEPFRKGQLAGWDVHAAESLGKAHFLVQHGASDVLLLDASAWAGDDPEGMAWLAGPRQTPVLLLSPPEPDTIAAGLNGGADLWLPRDLALEHPPLLAAALGQALRCGDLRRQVCRGHQALGGCRRQVSRLLDLLWQSAPAEGQARWFTQRYMLERLREEIARTGRQGTPFSVVLAEFHPPAVGSAGTGAPHLDGWAAERLTRDKRRCDVLGRYGPHGFMLLLTGAGEAGATAFCRRLERALRQAAEGEGVPLTACFGVAACSSPSATPQGLLRRAEERLEEARGAGQEDASV